MSFKKERDTVSRYINKHHKSFSQHPERDAILTHWALNQDIRPPEMPARVFKDCCEIFSQSDASDDIPYPPPKKAEFTFIDLFAGIGGFRIAFQNVGGRCVFSSEWDRYAKETYKANFGEVPYGDIREIKKRSVPDHDILLAGFPCQPFSLAGVSKKRSLGRKHGFQDETQGTLFFEIKEILKKKKPKAFMLENVKNLLSHDNKHTFKVIMDTLIDLGYVVSWKIVDGANWVPQHRERIFIVGYHPDKINITRDKIVIPEKPRKKYKRSELKDIILRKVDEKYTLGPGTWSTLERHKKHHAAAGNGFGYGLHTLPISNGSIARTISARYHKDGGEVLIQPKSGRPRRLTIGEVAQLQGFDPERFRFPVSDTQAYKQLGNSVVVPAVLDTAREMAKVVRD